MKNLLISLLGMIERILFFHQINISGHIALVSGFVHDDSGEIVGEMRFVDPASFTIECATPSLVLDIPEELEEYSFEFEGAEFSQDWYVAHGNVVIGCTVSHWQKRIFAAYIEANHGKVSFS